MLNRYRVIYVGDDSHDHGVVVWAHDHDEAVAKVEATGVEMVSGVKKLMSPLTLLLISLAVAGVAVLAVVQMI